MKRILVLSDSQFGSEDKVLHRQLVSFIEKYQPDHIVHVGDLLDCKAPARWSRATAEEFAGSLQREVDDCHAWLAAIRRVYDGPFDWKSGNHCRRIAVYLKTRAPALASLRALSLESLLELDSLNIQLHHKFIKIAPSWVVCHGDEGSLSRYSGGTAMNIARKIGKNVVCGHTHRAGIITESVGYGGHVRHLTGFEVGNAMDMRKANYLPTGSANWQKAFGILYVDGHRVTPSLIPIHADGSFYVEGQRYGGPTQ